MVSSIAITTAKITVRTALNSFSFHIRTTFPHVECCQGFSGLTAICNRYPSGRFKPRSGTVIIAQMSDFVKKEDRASRLVLFLSSPGPLT